MSIRVDTVSLIPGAIVCGNRGLGVIGSLIPASGDHGPGYTYNDLTLPNDNGKEICGRITTWPTNGILTAFEDTSFEYTGTTDAFQYQLYVDGVAVGSPATAILQVGNATSNYTVLADDANFSGGSLASPVTFISTSFDQAIFSGFAFAKPTAVVSAISDDTVCNLAVLSGSKAIVTAFSDNTEFLGGSITSAQAVMAAFSNEAVFLGGASASAQSIISAFSDGVIFLGGARAVAHAIITTFNDNAVFLGGANTNAQAIVTAFSDDAVFLGGINTGTQAVISAFSDNTLFLGGASVSAQAIVNALSDESLFLGTGIGLTSPMALSDSDIAAIVSAVISALNTAIIPVNVVRETNSGILTVKKFIGLQND